jgi:hypothetical protein
MIRLETTTLWLAACSAVLGTACIVLFMEQPTTDGLLLSKASLAAFFSIASLVLGVFMITSPFFRPSHPLPGRDGSSVPAGASEHCRRFEQFTHRQKIIAKRMNIDAPHLCSQTGAACTAWSLCGSARAAQATASSSADVCGHPTSLPIIDRRNLALSCLALAPDADIDGLS